MHDRAIIVKSCGRCPLQDDDFGVCKISTKIVTESAGIPYGCPLENQYDQPMQTNKLWGNDLMHIIVRKDGEAWFAHDETFTDLQESEAEFGDTPEEAACKFIIRCKKPRVCGNCNRSKMNDFMTLTCDQIVQGELVVVSDKRPACDKWQRVLETEGA